MQGVVTWPVLLFALVNMYELFFCVYVDLCSHIVIENLCAANDHVFIVLRYVKENYTRLHFKVFDFWQYEYL